MQFYGGILAMTLLCGGLGTLLKMLGHDMLNNTNVSGSKDRLLRRLDCAVIENLHTLNTENPFDSVRGVFIEGDPLYEGAGFYEKSHIQIYIRNPNCIKAFFISRETVKWPKKIAL